MLEDISQPVAILVVLKFRYFPNGRDRDGLITYNLIHIGCKQKKVKKLVTVQKI